jgi:iron only hydrogenase large subunit-like protein
VLDDFAGHPLLERKETPLARMMTKCRHYSCTFIVAVQTVKYVIKNIRRQATDLVVWAGLSEEDFHNLFKEIAYSYNEKVLWEEYRRLPTQTSHMILNVKAQKYKFVVVEVK